MNYQTSRLVFLIQIILVHRCCCEVCASTCYDNLTNSSKKIDDYALKICKSEPNVFIGIFFPNTFEYGLPNVRAIIKSYGQLVCEKTIWLKNDGFMNFIAQLPTKKAKWHLEYFPVVVRKKHPMHVFLFICADGLAKAVECKDKIRSIYKMRPRTYLRDIRRAFHTTDSQKEAIYVANIVFNNNSLNFINNKSYNFDLKKINELRQFIALNANIDDICFKNALLGPSQLDNVVRDINDQKISFSDFKNAYECCDLAANNDENKCFFYHGLKFAC